MPIACGAEIQPETKPRWATGTWSEIVAVSAAVSTQNPVRASDHQMPTPDEVGLQAEHDQRDREGERAAEDPGAAAAEADVVRSERAPVSG